MASRERMRRNARDIPAAHSFAAHPREEEFVPTSMYMNEDHMDVQSPNNAIAFGLPNHAIVEAGSPNQPFSLYGSGGSVRQISRLVPDLARLTVESPCYQLSSVLQNLSYIEVDTPAQAMASPVWNQMAEQIDSPARATVPAVPNDVMMQEMPNYIEIDDSPMQPLISTPRRGSTLIPVQDLSRRIENMAGPSGSPLSATTRHATANPLRDSFMPMAQFESKIWRTFGYKNIAVSDRAKNLDSDPLTTKVYHCNVEIRGDSVVTLFKELELPKGPYIGNTRTHLQKVVGDDNVLVVKFMEKLSETKTDFSTYCEHYHKVANDGILLGLRRYQFFIYKDGGKEKKMIEGEKRNSSSTVRCYFVRTESGWNTDEPYILSGKTVGQARELFMHINTAPTLAKYMARLALILSKTITLDADLSQVLVRLIDEPCLDEHGNVVLRDGEPLIRTDGTGLISEDLALKCPTSIFKGKFLKSQGIATCDEGETMMKPNSLKRHRSLAAKHPLLMQFRLFYYGSAVKGTVLVDRRLSPGNILVRPSMLRSYPELSDVQSVNSSEIVFARNAKKSLSGVQSVNSFEIVSTRENPRNVIDKCPFPRNFSTNSAFHSLVGGSLAWLDCCHMFNPHGWGLFGIPSVSQFAFSYADMEDSISARMILSGIPLEESYLQSRLAFMARQERKGIKQGKIPIDECYYLMGTTDPTGTLGPNEVCVILENGQLCGDVLVYKHPGLHFGDIHVLKATYIKDLEKKYVGYSKYAILFPTSGPRSLADEMANSDFDGDMYWVSKNPKLLEHFKPSEPWVETITPKRRKQKKPQDFNESKLERLLFHEFLKTRFTPSYALDAPKTGNKVNIASGLITKRYPHFMGRIPSYHSSSILGQIYDRAEDIESLRYDNVAPSGISLLPCFTERDAPPETKRLWQQRYEEYLTDSRLLYEVDKEERNMKFQKLYEKYKR
uniref:RNA-dependent RNA polymerase n=1 Tax=Oryza brachyantha TaxID=4533 RepID=J3KXC5_ORYBR